MLKGKTPLLIALICGLLAGAAAWVAIQSKVKEVKAGWNLVPVLVAVQDIPEGTELTYDMVSQRPIPEQFVTSSVVTPQNANQILGQRLVVSVQRGDAILWSHLNLSRETEQLSKVITQKGRVITLDITSSKMSVGGWIRPNDHVDIIGSFRNPESGEQMAVTLMQNVIVLATGKITGTTNRNIVPENELNFSTVSLMVLPEEAEILALASELGSLTMTLRHPDDIELQQERGQRSTIQTLLTGERTKDLLKQRINTIQVIKGTETRTPAAR